MAQCVYRALFDSPPPVSPSTDPVHLFSKARRMLPPTTDAPLALNPGPMPTRDECEYLASVADRVSCGVEGHSGLRRAEPRGGEAHASLRPDQAHGSLRPDQAHASLRPAEPLSSLRPPVEPHGALQQAAGQALLVAWGAACAYVLTKAGGTS